MVQAKECYYLYQRHYLYGRIGLIYLSGTSRASSKGAETSFGVDEMVRVLQYSGSTQNFAHVRHKTCPFRVGLTTKCGVTMISDGDSPHAGYIQSLPNTSNVFLFLSSQYLPSCSVGILIKYYSSSASSYPVCRGLVTAYRANSTDRSSGLLGNYQDISEFIGLLSFSGYLVLSWTTCMVLSFPCCPMSHVIQIYNKSSCKPNVTQPIQRLGMKKHHR